MTPFGCCTGPANKKLRKNLTVDSGPRRPGRLPPARPPVPPSCRTRTGRSPGSCSLPPPTSCLSRWRRKLQHTHREGKSSWGSEEMQLCLWGSQFKTLQVMWKSVEFTHLFGGIRGRANSSKAVLVLWMLGIVPGKGMVAWGVIGGVPAKMSLAKRELKCCCYWSCSIMLLERGRNPVPLLGALNRTASSITATPPFVTASDLYISSQPNSLFTLDDLWSQCPDCHWHLVEVVAMFKVVVSTTSLPWYMYESGTDTHALWPWLEGWGRRDFPLFPAA